MRSPQSLDTSISIQVTDRWQARAWRTKAPSSLWIGARSGKGNTGNLPEPLWPEDRRLGLDHAGSVLGLGRAEGQAIQREWWRVASSACGPSQKGTETNIPR